MRFHISPVSEQLVPPVATPVSWQVPAWQVVDEAHGAPAQVTLLLSFKQVRLPLVQQSNNTAYTLCFTRDVQWRWLYIEVTWNTGPLKPYPKLHMGHLH